MTWFWGNESERATAIFDENKEHILETVRFMSVQVGQSKSFSNQTLESGLVVADNVIDNQDQINLQLILDPDNYVDVFAEIQSLYDSVTAISVQTRVETYNNLYIESMPHDEGSSIANTVAINISLVEQQIVSSTTQVLSEPDVSNSADASTVKSGQKSSTESTTVLQDLFGSFL